MAKFNKSENIGNCLCVVVFSCTVVFFLMRSAFHISATVCRYYGMCNRENSIVFFCLSFIRVPSVQQRVYDFFMERRKTLGTKRLTDTTFILIPHIYLDRYIKTGNATKCNRIAVRNAHNISNSNG
mmetsp:Transcript_14006/g.32676  ORF Transcript_14006/g.32676 Transcript_14006/m.32676 type:complete len:126 (-) Transcript_14006:1421-1798(-)